MSGKENMADNPAILLRYDEMKRKHPDAILLFRLGDFYETYREDAERSSKILSITTTERNIGGENMKVAGFPHNALDSYLPKLVRTGARVAICEQLDDPRLKKEERQSQKKEQSTLTDTDMPKKKKEKAQQEEPAKTAKAAVEEKPATEKKNDVKSGDDREAQQERKPREPQMVTVNGEKVTHGHAYQSKTNPEDWYFTAKLDGQQLKPQKMDPADLAAYQKKEMTVPQLMERYYPTKLMERVPETAYQFPNVITGPDKGTLTVDKFNVYKEKDEQRPDFGKYKFYAQIGEQKMSAVASRQDLNAYFDRVMTPGQLVEKNFGDRLHLKSHYEQFSLPEGVDPKSVRVAKDRSDGLWKVSADLGEHGRTSKKEISFDDGFSLFKTKTATREQIAAKYLGDEIRTMLAAPSMKTEQAASMKM